jgi:hypothetical protein
VENGLTGVHAGEGHKVVDKAGHAAALKVDDLQCVVQFGGLAVAGEHAADLQVDDRQRRAQLVAGIGYEQPLTIKRLLEAGEHIVEGAAKLCELVTAAEVQAAAQICLADVAGGARDGTDGAHGTVCEPEATEECNGEHGEAS